MSLPTSEYQGGQWVTIDAPFRVYHNDAESIADHAELLATSGYYTRAMADRAVPDAFANDLTGVYATDPDYGANLVALMKLYNLYQFDSRGRAGPGSDARDGTSPTARRRRRRPPPRRPPRRHAAPSPARRQPVPRGRASIPGAPAAHDLAASAPASRPAPRTAATAGPASGPAHGQATGNLARAPSPGSPPRRSRRPRRP